MLIEILSLVTIVIGWIIWKWFQEFIYSKTMPGPIGLPLLGSALSLQNLPELLNTLHKFHKQYGKIYKLKIAWYNLVIIADDKFIQYILSSNKFIRKGEIYKTLDKWSGDGLLISEGEKWRKRRKMLTPSFHYTILEDYIQIFEQNGLFLINNLKQQLNKSSFDIHTIVSLYTLDVICETSMGTTINAQQDPDHNEYVEAVDELCRIGYDKVTKPEYQFNFLYRLTNAYRKELKYCKIIHDFSKEIIKNRRHEINKNVNNPDFANKKKISFLDLLLKSTIDGKPLSDSDITEEVHTFMFEGHDTTAMALSGALYSLANNQDIQQKAFEEINDIIGNEERPVNMTDFNNMKYLELIIKEALRVYTIVPIYGRELEENLEYENYKISKKTMLVINQYAIHKDPEIYPNPDKFDPERFTKENCAKRNPYAFVAFSAGPRNCIGQKFAMLELKSAICKVLRNFILLPAVPRHDLKLGMMLTMAPLNGVHVQLKQR